MRTNGRFAWNALANGEREIDEIVPLSRDLSTAVADYLVVEPAPTAGVKTRSISECWSRRNSCTGNIEMKRSSTSALKTGSLKAALCVHCRTFADTGRAEKPRKFTGEIRAPEKQHSRSQFRRNTEAAVHLARGKLPLASNTRRYALRNVKCRKNNAVLRENQFSREHEILSITKITR